MTQQKVQHKERFFFESSAIKQDSCKVVRFSGVEGLNTLYSFELTLVSQDFLDMDAFMVSPCTLKIARDQAKAVQFHGFPSSCTQKSHINGWTFYTVTMEPQFSRLRGIVHNAIYLNKNVQELVDKALGRCGIIKPEHEFHLQSSYPTYEFSMQYNEDAYAYICHFLEREGIYYYFDQQNDHEKVIFSDAPINHTPIEGDATLTYSPTSGLETPYMDEVIVSFNKMYTPLPKYVHVRDYDWQNPNVPVVATATVKEQGLGELFFYGDGFTSTEEGQRLANIRAQALRCRGVTFQGLSAVPRLSPGYIFTLDKHFDASCNAQYLITEVRHEGSQEGYLSMVLGITLEHPTDTVYYRNSFTCIEKDVQFRAEHRTERKKISGMIHAFIDTASDAGIPEIDAFGRYKVIFPQDISGRGAGKASCWLRRAQPSVGQGYGTSFPLDSGVEVLISFTDGHPDRPFIAAALANSETGSVDYEGSSLVSGMTTAGGGGLIFHDKGEKQALNLVTGSGRSGLFMTSGSLDSSIIDSDSLVMDSTTYSYNYAALLNIFSSKLHASISAKSKIDDLGALKLLTKETTNLCKASKVVTNTKEKIAKDKKDENAQKKFNNQSKNLERIASITKLFNTALVALGDGKSIWGTSPPPYMTNLTSSKDDLEGKLTLLAPVDGITGWGALIGEIVAELTAKALIVSAEGVATDYELKATVYDKDKNVMTKSEKRYTHARDFSTALGPLVAEIMAIFMLFSHTFDKDKYGGIRIKSDDANVAIASATNTHIASNGNISLIAKANTAVAPAPDNGALGEVNTKSGNTLVNDINAAAGINAPYLYGEANNIKFEANESIAINATDNATITSNNATINVVNDILMNSSNDILITADQNTIIRADQDLTIEATQNLIMRGSWGRIAGQAEDRTLKLTAGNIVTIQ